MKAADLTEEIVAFIQKRDWVTFVELGREFDHKVAFAGEFALTATTYRNIVYWVGMSEAWADLIGGLLREERIWVHPTSTFVYLIDGGFLQMPLVRRVRAYKEPHWLPVCLRTVPLPAKGGRR